MKKKAIELFSSISKETIDKNKKAIKTEGKKKNIMMKRKG